MCFVNGSSQEDPIAFNGDVISLNIPPFQQTWSSSFWSAVIWSLFIYRYVPPHLSVQSFSALKTPPLPVLLHNTPPPPTPKKRKFKEAKIMSGEEKPGQRFSWERSETHLRDQQCPQTTHTHAYAEHGGVNVHCSVPTQQKKKKKVFFRKRLKNAGDHNHLQSAALF